MNNLYTAEPADGIHTILSPVFLYLFKQKRKDNVGCSLSKWPPTAVPDSNLHDNITTERPRFRFFEAFSSRQKVRLLGITTMLPVKYMIHLGAHEDRVQDQESM